jgi:HSP20 family protein
MTTLVRWDPAAEVDSLQSEVNRLFDGFFGSGRSRNGAARWIPAMDLAEEEAELVLTADLPGLTEEDLSIEIKDRVLTISGERRAEAEREGKAFHRVERSFGRFTRSLNLPAGVDPEGIAANFANGVLEVRIPKPEERRPHLIEIGSGGGAAIEAEAEEK